MSAKQIHCLSSEASFKAAKDVLDPDVIYAWGTLAGIQFTVINIQNTREEILVVTWNQNIQVVLKKTYKIMTN
jgi:hypothetical protein